MTFKDYFNAVDDEHVTHTGFLQSMDLSGYTDITMLNDLTMVLMDAYLFNELSSAVVMRQWRKYLTYDRDNHAFVIDPDFYSAFTAALYGYLSRSQRWYQLTQTDFTSLSATEIKTIEHGKQEKQLDFGAGQVTRAYGEDETERAYGQDALSKAYGATQKTAQHGAQTITRDYDRVVVGVTKGNDTHIVGAAHTEGTTTNTAKVYPLGAAAYVDDTQQIQLAEQDTDQQTNTDTFGDQTTTTNARQDGEGHAAYSDTESTTAKTDTETRSARTDTETRAARTDTESTAAKQNKEEVKAYTDTERRTKYILISPEKYYEIEKELVTLGAYDLMKQAVADTMLLNVWEGGDCYADHVL